MNNPLDFSGKVALVTGAAAGMGLATANAFAEAGAAVVLADYKKAAVQAAAERLMAHGHKAIAVGCDVSDDAQVAAMVDRTVAEFGRLDAAFNNASVGALGGNPGIGPYIASKHGVIGLTRTAALEYVRQGIRVNAVNPGLIDTQVGRDVFKGDENVYAEAAKTVPMGRAGTPDEIAAAVLWLCSPGASYVAGHALTVDGGMTAGH
jgi:NAD(P)-dependent dehydrogenase (short-subunit alcohol dehydrogenase family)